jgi:hypothetical protein
MRGFPHLGPGRRKPVRTSTKEWENYEKTFRKGLVCGSASALASLRVRIRIQLFFFYLNADPDQDPESQTNADPDPDMDPVKTLPSQKV